MSAAHSRLIGRSQWRLSELITQIARNSGIATVHIQLSESK
jgi:hypothetical protein